MKTIAYCIIYFVIQTTAIQKSITTEEVVIHTNEIQFSRVFKYNPLAQHQLTQELVTLITDFSKE